MNILHLARRKASPHFTLPAFQQELSKLGTFTLQECAEDLNPDDVLALIRDADVLLTGHGTLPVPEDIALFPGKLRYICHVTGTLQGMVPQSLIESGLQISNWGDAPANELAEASLTLLLTLLKEIPRHIRHTQSGKWWEEMPNALPGHLFGLTIGLYGYGFSGKAFHTLLRPFRAKVRIYDPFVDDIPEDAERVNSLAALFDGAHAVSIHAGLTPETRGSVTGDLLARLPDGGILINTARGGLVEQDALFAELESGRLRAGLDVLAGTDDLPADHPARQWPNLVLTRHKLTRNVWPDNGDLKPLHGVCLENLRRFRDGKAIRFRIDAERMSLTT
jgi:phosphoglycerate dehydrogenase-like enzyme